MAGRSGTGGGWTEGQCGADSEGHSSAGRKKQAAKYSRGREKAGREKGRPGENGTERKRPVGKRDAFDYRDPCGGHRIPA